MNIKIELLREELLAAGINYYACRLSLAGQLVISFLENGVKRAPTAAEQTAIDAVVSAHDPQGQTQAEQLEATIKSNLTASVGVALNNLTAAQRNSLVAALLWRAGAIDTDMTIRPLAEWLK